jgi:hypothetical protein
MTTVDFTGTVSHGTMQPRDLIPAFVAILEHYKPEIARERLKEWTEIQNEQEQDIMESELVDRLFDDLDRLAPDGYYFGAHPGDGSDYGYWQFEG